MFLISIVALLYKYCYNFIEALYQTDLSNQKKQIAEKTLLCIALLSTVFFASKVENILTHKFNESPIMISEKQIDELIADGYTVIVGITADWSYFSNLNKITTLNKATLKQLEKAYKIKYIEINSTNMLPNIREFLQKHNKTSLPVYVLYNINMNKGIVLPELLNRNNLEQYIQNFKF